MRHFVAGFALIAIACSAEPDSRPKHPPADDAGAPTDAAATADADAAPAGPCTLYQSYEYDAHPESYSNCSQVPVPYDDIVPRETSGDLSARTVPRCVDGSDGPCPGREVRCQDGTRPFYHIDKAVDASGKSIDTNRWVFFFQGGGSCRSFEDCSAQYATPEGGEQTALHPNPQFKSVGTFVKGEGILSAQPASPFSTFNRVKFYKCSNEKFAGNRTLVDSEAGTVLYFHGRKIIEAVLNDLGRSRGSVTLGTDGVLPSLANATNILVSGNSGGASGLIQNGDWIADLLAARSKAAVRFVLDARIEPSVESEAHFEAGGNGPPLFAGDWNGKSQLQNGLASLIIERSDAFVRPGGGDRFQFENWGDPKSLDEPFMDASCFSRHAADPSPCFDEYHVLYHHMSVDRFMYQSLADHNHRNNIVRWVTSPTPFAFVPGNPPESQFLQEFKERVIYSADQFLRNRAQSDEQPPPIYDLAIMIPDHERHVNLVDDHYFFQASMSLSPSSGPTVTRTFASALEDWLETGGDRMIVDDRATVEKVQSGGGWVTSE